MFENLYFTRLLYSKIERLSASDLDVEHVVTLSSPELIKHTLVADDKDRTGQWAALFESILMIKSHCSSRGTAFLLAIYPWGHQVNESEWIPGRYAFIEKGASVSDASENQIRDFARREKVPLLDTHPIFRASDHLFPLYYKADMHLTVNGHGVMARAFAEHIFTAGLLHRHL